MPLTLAVWQVAAADGQDIDRIRVEAISGAATGVSGTSAVLPTGNGVLIAIVDSGIDLTHPEFDGRIVAGGSCFGDSVMCAGSAALGQDDNGHGTHVAGIAAAANDGLGTTGVAPKAGLLAVKVLAASGSGSYLGVAQGIDYASAQHANIINMSLGGSKPGSSDSAVLVGALKDAAVQSLIVVAAGNEARRSPTYPAAFATQAGIVGNMIIVGSVKADNRTISSFSNTPGSGGCTGPTGSQTCFRDVFLVAPGERIRSTLPNGAYGVLSGTSMATPYVSGVAAQVWSAAPYLTAHDVAQILFASAIDLGRRGTDVVFGRGLINPAGALAPLGSLSIATSGANTATRSGTGEVGKSQVTGVFSSVLRNSATMRDVVFFDSFGRDFHADLSTVGMRRPAMLSAVRETRGNESELADLRLSLLPVEGLEIAFGYRTALRGQPDEWAMSGRNGAEGLFLTRSAFSSPFLAFADDADFLSGRFQVSPSLGVAFGHVSQAADPERVAVDRNHLRSGEGDVAAVNWQFSSWGAVGTNVTVTREDNALFGGLESGALALTDHARTASMGLDVRLDLPNAWLVRASWNSGVSEVTPVSGGLLAGFTPLRTEAYGVALSRKSLLSDGDVIGLSVSRPLHVIEGNALLRASTGVTLRREIIYSSEEIDLAGLMPETQIELGYAARLDGEWVLQLSSMVQLDADGVAGRNQVAGLIGLNSRW